MYNWPIDTDNSQERKCSASQSRIKGMTIRCWSLTEPSDHKRRELRIGSRRHTGLCGNRRRCSIAEIIAIRHRQYMSGNILFWPGVDAPRTYAIVSEASTRSHTRDVRIGIAISYPIDKVGLGCPKIIALTRQAANLNRGVRIIVRVVIPKSSTGIWFGDSVVVRSHQTTDWSDRIAILIRHSSLNQLADCGAVVYLAHIVANEATYGAIWGHGTGVVGNFISGDWAVLHHGSHIGWIHVNEPDKCTCTWATIGWIEIVMWPNKCRTISARSHNDIL